MGHKRSKHSDWHEVVDWVVVIAGVVLSVALTTYVTHDYLKPRLVCMISDPFRETAQEQSTTIEVTNRGLSAATSVRIEIWTAGRIKDYRIRSVEPVSSKIENGNRLVLNMSRLVQERGLGIRVTTETQTPYPISKIEVLADQGPAESVTRLVEPTMSLLTSRDLNLIGSVATTIIAVVCLCLFLKEKAEKR